MPPRSDKWIRSLTEDKAGKVVADGERNRSKWQADDDTHRLLPYDHSGKPKRC